MQGRWQYLSVVDDLLEYLGQYISDAGPNGTAVGGGRVSGRRLQQSASPAPATFSLAGFIQDLHNASALAATLNGALTALSSAARAAASAADDGPDPAATLDRLHTALRPDLAALTTPTSTLSAATTAYNATRPQDMTNEINEAMGRSYAVPDDVDETDLMDELDALEADLAVEDAGKEGPSYLQEPELELPAAPTKEATAGQHEEPLRT
ncbi:hypothetical protein TSOC_007590 [Tetrabaena socialis]|uniref:Uncharacterized protein n=1 Tax=Tetrabaena socialis TaxID=47790 RepID=A0A2J8A0Q1_9CHLO|nr:hypothetical protein TSOC_007590 [Tetrabaena socialis]|eukprot:PNH06068.1 hypothetical protein TSOC_007590 [Tetrabaena socialis]